MNSVRIDLMEMLQGFSEVYPEWRMGQLVANLTSLANDGTPREIWDIEDEELLQAARKHLEKRTKSIAD